VLPPILPPSSTQRTPHYFQRHREMQPSGGTGYSERTGRQPLSNCFYGGAFPQCLAWYFGLTQSAGCPGTFSQSKIGKRERGFLLCVSFECDSLSEELEEEGGFANDEKRLLFFF
jgi:hypothetical protein